MPGLVNAHTHFELSALKGLSKVNLPFKEWVRQVLQKREAIDEDTLKQKASRAMKACLTTGTLSAAEISTLGITESLFRESGLGGVWFREFLGSISSSNIEQEASEKDTPPQKAYGLPPLSLAGHAPHTSSPELLQKLKQICSINCLPFSIHLAESRDETEFITTAKGPWASFLNERGIDFHNWPIPSRSPVSYLDDLKLLDSQTMAVHLLNVDKKDLNIISESRTKPVVCPRSNMALHGKLPDLPKFLNAGLMPALGTDSLASTPSLGMFDEMAFVAQKYPQINPADIFAMATLNGAMALGIDKFTGTLEKGRKADFIYLPIHIKHSRNIFEIITGHKFTSIGQA